MYATFLTEHAVTSYLNIFHYTVYKTCYITRWYTNASYSI